MIMRVLSIAGMAGCLCWAVAQAQDLVQTPGSDTEQVEKYTQFALQNPGDVQRGNQIFENNRQVACNNCHVVDGIEKSGPNLAGIADKYPPAELIKHILDPNLFIQPGYETVTILTRSGDILTGRVRLSTRFEMRLLMADGKLKSIKREEIEDIKSSMISMMPTNLVATLSLSEFSDLVAYLGTLHRANQSAWQGQGKRVDVTRAAKKISLQAIHSIDQKFENPVWVGGLPGHPGQLIVLEHQAGCAIRLDLNQQPPEKSVFLDLSDEITFSPNQGLMCLAFHPDYVNNRRYFVKYEVKRSGGEVFTTVNERLAAENLLVDSGKPSRELLEQHQPAFNHNGGCLAFGPDGLLYIAFGDGGPQKDPPGFSQNPRVFHGSMLRIDVNRREKDLPYGIPPDNPFLSNKDPLIKRETWAIGFREPWRFSFDSLTGDLWLGDVGQNEFEEVCLVKPGENHGWNVYEGFTHFSDEYRRVNEIYTDPLLAYPRSMGVSVTGGFVYRANKASPYYGAYIFGDYESRKIWALRQEAGQLVSLREIGSAEEHIAAFGLDSDGQILMVGYEGTIFRLGL
ncbi:MAG: PQQ-dependent sugar dehydrogenase [Planctomycetales bacterium]|nr:PQQ-dependent sugar dehydrogenase [Planctomycetales bacterium]